MSVARNLHGMWIAIREQNSSTAMCQRRRMKDLAVQSLSR